MSEKGQLFLTADRQLINVARMRETENHHGAISIVIITVGNNHQRTLKLVSESMLRNKRISKCTRTRDI